MELPHNITDGHGDCLCRKLIDRSVDVACSLGNAMHIKQVPGRKTDVKDSEWIADFIRHGLVRPSFVPPRPLRESCGTFALPAQARRFTRMHPESSTSRNGYRLV
jgi:hypothetical protein